MVLSQFIVNLGIQGKFTNKEIQVIFRQRLIDNCDNTITVFIVH